MIEYINKNKYKLSAFIILAYSLFSMANSILMTTSAQNNNFESQQIANNIIVLLTFFSSFFIPIINSIFSALLLKLFLQIGKISVSISDLFFFGILSYIPTLLNLIIISLQSLFFKKIILDFSIPFGSYFNNTISSLNMISFINIFYIYIYIILIRNIVSISERFKATIVALIVNIISIFGMVFSFYLFELLI